MTLQLPLFLHIRRDFGIRLFSIYATDLENVNLIVLIGSYLLFIVENDHHSPSFNSTGTVEHVQDIV